MPLVNISNGTIIELTSERGDWFVTVTYRTGTGNRGAEETVRLVVSRRTIILNADGKPVLPSELRVGMIVDASFSSVMTRSIPPQTAAYLIRIVRRQREEKTTVGRIMDVNRKNRNFIVMVDWNPASIIRFNVSENTRIFDRAGRPMNFSELMSGMHVRVRHSGFMTASVPPQTTAFEVRTLQFQLIR